MPIYETPETQHRNLFFYYRDQEIKNSFYSISKLWEHLLKIDLNTVESALPYCNFVTFNTEKNNFVLFDSY